MSNVSRFGADACLAYVGEGRLRMLLEPAGDGYACTLLASAEGGALTHKGAGRSPEQALHNACRQREAFLADARTPSEFKEGAKARVECTCGAAMHVIGEHVPYCPAWIAKGG